MVAILAILANLATVATNSPSQAKLSKLIVFLLCMAGCVPLLGGIPALKPLLRQAEAAMDSMDYDRAQALYRRVANSYDVALPDSDRLLCLDGIYGCCDIEMNKGNYSEALENLNLAEKIVEREKTSDMKLQVRYGAMYIIMAQQTLNAKFLQKGITLRWKKGVGTLRSTSKPHYGTSNLATSPRRCRQARRRRQLAGCHDAPPTHVADT